MVFYFTASNGWTVYMGRDKFENEELLKYSFDTDIWFHVDDLSSAHVYLRMPPRTTINDIPADVLEECKQLVKANSIKGCKLASTHIVYTPVPNLRKQADMDVGQVGYYKMGLVKRVLCENNKDIAKRIARTKEERNPDLRAEKEAHESEVMRAEKATRKQAKQAAAREVQSRKQEAKEKEERKMIEDAEDLDFMVSNLDMDASADDSAARAYEDDFM